MKQSGKKEMVANQH